MNDAASIAHAVVDGSSADEYDPVANAGPGRLRHRRRHSGGHRLRDPTHRHRGSSGTGRTATYTVKLNTQPTGDVTITPSSSQESAATVSGALTFTTRQLEHGADRDGERGVDDDGGPAEIPTAPPPSATRRSPDGD